MANKPTWKTLMEMSPSDRAKDFLVRAQGLPSTLIRQDGVVQVPLLELYQALYTGVPRDNRRRKVLTDSLARKGVLASDGKLGPSGATWTVNLPQAGLPTGQGTSPGDDVLPEGKEPVGHGTMPDDEGKKVPADEAEEPDLSPVHVQRRLAEIDLSVQTRKVKVLTFAEHMLETAQAEGLDRGELDEAVNWVRKSL